MSVSILSAAKYLCQKSGWSLTPLHVQKLIYVAHLAHLHQTGGPLVDEHFLAESIGPLNRQLFRETMCFGSSPVENVFHAEPDVLPGTEARALDKAMSVFGGEKSKLITVTEGPDSAFLRLYKPGKSELIDRASMMRKSELLERYIADSQQEGLQDNHSLI